MMSNLIMGKNMKKLVLVIGLFMVIVGNVSAAGIGLRPLRTNITIEPGKSKDIILTIINNENFPQVIKPEFQTYTSHDKNGFPVAKKIQKDNPNNIESWIKFENDDVTVEANSEVKTKVTVSVPKDAEPGGKYGALIYGPIFPNALGVSIRTRVASLLLLTVAGDEEFDGEVLEFSVANNGKFFSDKGIEFVTNFKNKGNVHINPQGTISIINEKGEKISNIYKTINEDKKEMSLDEIPVNAYGNFVLPSFDREFKSIWTENISNGNYVAKLNFAFKKGGSKKTVSKEINLEIKDDLVVDSFEFSGDEKESFFNLKIKNNGTVYEKIKGTIDVLNDFNYKVGEVVVPKDIDYIAPGEVKNIKLNFLDKKLPDGSYTVKSNIMYGFQNKVLEIKSNFGSNNNFLIFGIGGGIALFIISILLLLKRKKSKNNA